MTVGQNLWRFLYLQSLIITRPTLFWIDAICILQDSHEDWALHSKNMGNVYANVYCTISTCGSSDANGGCFHERTAFSRLCLLSALFEAEGIGHQGHGAYLRFQGFFCRSRSERSQSPGLGLARKASLAADSTFWSLISVLRMQYACRLQSHEEMPPTPGKAKHLVAGTWVRALPQKEFAASPRRFPINI